MLGNSKSEYLITKQIQMIKSQIIKFGTFDIKYCFGFRASDYLYL